jgi:hypothetical protein
MKDLNDYGVIKGVYADDCLVDRVMKNKDLYYRQVFFHFYFTRGEFVGLRHENGCETIPGEPKGH